MVKPKVEIYQPVDETGESYKRMEKAGISVIQRNGVWGAMANESTKEEIIFDSDVVVGVGVANRTHQITKKSFGSAPDLRMVAKYTVGFDNVDVNTASDLGILVVHSPTESNWGGVAEGTMANMLALLKKVRERDRHVKGGGWRDMSLSGIYLGSRLSDGYSGLTVGIIGFGRIGSRLARLLDPWKVRLLGCDPYVDEAKLANHNVSQVELNTLLEESDVVTIHCDLNDETSGLISSPEFKIMKPSAFLINAARGPIVDTDALENAILKNQIAGAALDVLPEEPPNRSLSLLGLGDKILLSPHMIAANDGNGLRAAIPWVENAVYEAIKGEVPKHVVNTNAIPKWLERFSGKSLI